MSLIDALAMQSQQQHRRYHELFGTAPVPGDRLYELARESQVLAEEISALRQQVIALDFSTEVLG